MPYIDHTEPVSFFSSSKIPVVKLKTVGEKIRFRILGVPYIDGKHFVFDEKTNKHVVHPCPRINESGECVFCEQYFLEKKESKTPKGKPAIFVYYPILNRETASVEILQTTFGVRMKIKQMIFLGVDLAKADFLLLRSAQTGVDTYTLTKVDSSETPPLSKKELDAIKTHTPVAIESIVSFFSGRRDEGEEASGNYNTIVVSV